MIDTNKYFNVLNDCGYLDAYDKIKNIVDRDYYFPTGKSGGVCLMSEDKRKALRAKRKKKKRSR